MSIKAEHHFVSTLQGFDSDKNINYILSRIHPQKNEFILVTIIENELKDQVGDDGKDKYTTTTEILSFREVENKVKEWCGEKWLSDESGHQFLASL